MKTEDEKNQVSFLLQKGFDYKKILNKIHFSKDCESDICLQRSLGKPMKRGSKHKLNLAKII